jgi:hypothetical protein
MGRKAMYNTTVRVLVAFGAISYAGAQYMAPTPPAPFAGFINEPLREHNAAMTNWDFGGSLRLRYEVKEGFAIPGEAGSVDFRDHGADVSNDYLLSRIRFHAGYSDNWWSVFVEGRSSMAASDERFAYANAPPVPGTVARQGSGPEADAIDLNQAYVAVGNPSFPLSLKVGRQELAYGEERLVGTNPWNNIGRVFDAAKVRWQNPWFSADFFTGRIVIPEDGRFDVNNDYDWFSGVYGTITKVPKHVLEVYFFARNASPQAIAAEPSPQETPLPSARDIYTFGVRFRSRPGELGPWDYSIESAGQLGDFRDQRLGANSARLDQEAWMVVAQGGYTFVNSWATPRLGLEYSHASGDSNPQDGKHETFDNLFPSNHKYYGYMNFNSLQNIHDVRGIFQLKPHPRVNVSLEGHALWLADTHDNFYTVSGTPRGGLGTTPGTGYGINPSYSSFVGTELDLIAGWAVTRYAQLEAGYGHFFTGEYIQQSLSSPAFGSKDADWFYLQLSVNF